MKKVMLPILLAFICFVFAGCDDNYEIDIYTTVYPLTFIVENIISGKAGKTPLKVKSAYPNTAEVHEYEPSPKTLISMKKAKMIAYIGLGLEAFIERSVNTIFKETNCVKVTDFYAVKRKTGKNIHLVIRNNETESFDPNKENEVYDPHIWLDPVQMSIIAEFLLEKMIDVEEFHQYEETFRANFKILSRRLDELSKKYKDEIEKTKGSTIIVDHDAFAYWTYEYNYTQGEQKHTYINRISIRNNDLAEPNLDDFQAIIKHAKKFHLCNLLVTKNEEQQNLVQAYIRALSEGKEEEKIDVKIRYIDNLSILTEENREKVKDYIDIMEENLVSLTKALNNDQN